MGQKNKKRSVFIFGAFFILLLFGYIFRGKLQAVFGPKAPPMRYFTQEMLEPTWANQMALEQRKESESYDLFHAFKFVDKRDVSGIDFVHKINPDGGKDLKAVHYDHGNGLVAADVNLDGHLDVLLVSLVGPVGLFTNNGDGQFSEVTQGSGLAVTGTKTCISASFGDIDNDGDPDLYISTIRDGNFLFENDGKGKFTDISEVAGVNYQGHSSGVVFFDYDKDGLLDIFVTNIGVYSEDKKKKFMIEGETYEYYLGLRDSFAGHLKEERFESSKLYHNMGGNRFEEVAEPMGINDLGWVGDASIVDPDHDGYPDLYVTNMQGNDIYYENNKGQGFTDKTAAQFPKTPWGSMGIAVFDFENDGLQDIYITDMHSDMLIDSDINDDFGREKDKGDVHRPESYLLTEGMSIFGNAFYKALEDASFQEVSDRINAENYWLWGLSNADLNADGFEDVFIASSMNYPFRYAINTVLLNEKGKKFRNSEFILGIEPRAEVSKPWFTLDCSVEDKDQRCRGRDGQVTIWGSNGSRSSLIFDLDGDGDLDIVTNEFNNSPQVLVSNLSNNLSDLSYLKIKLVGVQSNRDGIGAQVVVETAESTYIKLLTGKSGYLSQSSLPLYFGLNGAPEVKKITVKWPSGTQQELVNPGVINDLLTISEQAESSGE